MDGVTTEAEASVPIEDLLAGAEDADDGAAGTPRPMPYRVGSFEVRTDGVWAIDTTGEGEPEFVCGTLHILARTRGQDGDAWGALLHWQDADGRPHEWAMPSAMLAGDGLAVREALLDRGLPLAHGRKARERLLVYLSHRPKASALAVQRIGWHGCAYILPDATFGGTGERTLFQSADTPSHAYRAAGTLADWQAAIGRPCVGNTRLAFAVSCALAAPLLEVVGEEGGGFNLRGGSSTGKTTALQVAASVWGGGVRPSYMQQWRATANGLEAVAELHNDGLLVLDELGQVDAREAGEVAYMLANGCGKVRAGRSGGARRKAAWRLLFLSAGEIGLRDHMRAAGKQARAGQEVRLADIPMDAGAGLGGFEVIHGAESADAFARHLKDAAGKFYGTPIRAFLGALVQQDRDAAAQSAKAFKAAFIKEHVPAGASGEVSRVAGRFALVAAAGEVATAAGVLPWPPGEAMRAAAACYRAWLAGRGTTSAGDIEAGIAQVRRFIEEHGGSRFEPIGTAGQSERQGPTINRAGFRREHPNRAGATEFLFLPTVFREEVCRGFDARLVVAELVSRGVIVPGSEGKSTDKIRLASMGRPGVYRVQSSILEG